MSGRIDTDLPPSEEPERGEVVLGEGAASPVTTSFIGGLA
jgi:hypothetical protein